MNSMSLFLSISNLQSYQPSDCSNVNISDAIERECLSVLHKLHDQVNGLQLVQVVVQPLAKLFNPTSLAALAANTPPNKQSVTTNNVQTCNINNSPNSASHSNASTPSTNIPPTLGNSHITDLDGATPTSTSHSSQHSRSQSFASSFGTAGNIIAASSGSNSLLSTTNTYMMSPDTAQALIARLDTDRDVNWLMEIIGYGLSMPFSLTGEQDSVKDCCTIYCEWLASALLPFNELIEDSKYQQLNRLVPVPIKREPNRYARKMLSHLYNVFLPRQLISSTTATKANNQKDDCDAILTAVSRQAVLCHRVLRTIESIAQNKTNLMDDETWSHLVALLLTVNDKLLSPPTEPDDIGTQLHDRILGVLFDLMLLACSRSIPDASLWRTFHEMCLNWRHRPALVEHWKRITSLMTKRIALMPNQSTKISQLNLTIPNNLNPIENSICNMSYETLSQTWYRFLNLIGNPVDLSDPGLISRTDEFYHAACVANSVLDPRQHPCLNVLPQIFLNSMLGLKEFVDSFIGSYQNVNISTRRASQADSSNVQQQVPQFKLHQDRPKCNSLLHIFGDWLFSAALIGSDLYQDFEPNENDYSNISGSITSVTSSLTATEVELTNQSYSPAFRRKQSHQSTTSSHTSTSTTGRRRQSKQLDASGFSSETKITLEPQLTAESFESGQAEAMSILCKIFASKSSLEDVSPAYLARFYLCIQHCLSFGSMLDAQKHPGQTGGIKRQLLASILINSTHLLQKDLDGMNLLIPSFIKAIEFVFECNDKDIPIQPPPRQHSKTGSAKFGNNSCNQQLHNVTNYDLRKACILTLVNLLAYPPHFKDLAIRNCLDGTSPTTTFLSLRPRLMRLLFIALQTETDAHNMQILLGGLSLAVNDLNSSLDVGKGGSEVTNNKNDNNDRANATESMDMTDKADTVSQSSFVFDSSDGFLIKSLHVTCHLLINIWKHDNVVSLAALEVLTTIARVSKKTESHTHPPKQAIGANNNTIEMREEYMQTTKWICDYICNQCSRPPPAHSRDMHSTIVAAYQCLSVWFYNHPYLLTDNNSITPLMEVIELGVSGQKSKTTNLNPVMGITTQTVTSRREKIMKPSSMRVREAAEALLNICLVRMCNDGLKNIAACDTSFNEVDLVRMFGNPNFPTCPSNQINAHQLDSHRLFKYFSDEDSTIFGFLDGINHEVFGRDYVICLMRTQFGKHCWKFRFNYCSEKSREKIVANKTLGLMKRPFHQSSKTFSDANVVFPFQKGHNQSLYLNKDAKFFPSSIEELSTNDLDKLVTSLDDYSKGRVNTVKTDLQFATTLDKMSKIFSHQVLAEQKVASELSLRYSTVRHDCIEPQPGIDQESARILITHLGLKDQLGSEDHTSQAFVDSLKALDNELARTHDLVDIFYVRRNKTLEAEILDSTRDRHNVSLEFFEWLSELGRQGNHALNHSLSGNEISLFWGDMTQELTFKVPLKLDYATSCSVTIFWLECADDIVNLPIDLLHRSPKGSDDVCYFICPMKSGLFRVDMSKQCASPLINGMTLNRSSLSNLIRESVLNLCRRRRLDTDNYQPPHVKRRLLLQEFCHNYKIYN